MAWIGYMEDISGLELAITNEKNNLMNTLDNNFPTVKTAIENSWKGEDADKYITQLTQLVGDTKSAISDIYDEMWRQFKSTHEEWQRKQRGETTE